MDLWTQRGKQRVEQIERVALTYTHLYVYVTCVGPRGVGSGERLKRGSKGSGTSPHIWDIWDIILAASHYCTVETIVL